MARARRVKAEGRAGERGFLCRRVGAGKVHGYGAGAAAQAGLADRSSRRATRQHVCNLKRRTSFELAAGEADGRSEDCRGGFDPCDARRVFKYDRLIFRRSEH